MKKCSIILEEGDPDQSRYAISNEKSDAGNQRWSHLKFILIFFLHVSWVLDCPGQTNQIPGYATILSNYIQIPSEQYQEKSAGTYLMEECRQKGLFTEVLGQNDSAFNFIASLYPLSSRKPNIIFLNHIDVVPPGDIAAWTFQPYCGTIQENYIYGRGAIDNKGMAVAQMLAISEMVSLSKEQQLPYNVSILSVSGEETDGEEGAKMIAEQYIEKLNPYVVLGEGGSGVKGIIQSDPEQVVFGISTVEKSKVIVSLDMDIVASGHGSVPPKEYAMKEIIFALEKILKQEPEIDYNVTSVKALKTLGKYEKGISGFIQRNFTFFFFKPFVKKVIKSDPFLLSFFANTITLIKLEIPEGTNNMISQNARAIFDCRLLPNEKPDKFIKKINRWVKDDRVHVNVVTKVQAAPRTKNHKIFNHLKDAVQNFYKGAVVVEMIFPATTDNNFFREKDIPVYGVFPACFTEKELASIHSCNERISFDSMEKAIAIYSDFILQVLSEKP